MKEALHYTSYEDGKLRCELCPNACLLGNGGTGICMVRKNMLGRLITENYGMITALHSDPIEKKPLFHFFPGQQILSAGSFGCNFHCGWCQNHEISQAGKDDFPFLKPVSAHNLAGKAAASGGIGLAYTYNEPVVWFEFMMDTARLVREAGKKNVVVSNGYIQPGPLDELLEVADAFNIDLKGFSPGFYRKHCGASLDIIKKNLLAIALKGAHLEITFLAIPGLNDDLVLFREMTEWISGELGAHIPLHLSRYFPGYLVHHPTTTFLLLKQMYETAREHLHHVYLGNLPGHPEMSATRCHACGRLLAERNGYFVTLHQVDETGHCPDCGERVFHQGSLIPND